MRKTFSLLTAVAALLLAACGAADNSAGGPPADAGETAETDADQAGAGETNDDQCGAAEYQSLVGANIAAVTLPAGLNLRIIGPNDAVTMDFNPARLNIYTDESGLVAEVKCG